jgi:hypothetical protein
MYEFEYHPSFSSPMKPKTVKGDHGDEIYSVFGAPLLRGNSHLLVLFWETGSLTSSLGLVAFVKLLLLSCFPDSV